MNSIPQQLLIFGAGSFARKLAFALRAKGHTVLAHVTSREPAVAALSGTPVYHLANLPQKLSAGVPVLCGAFNRSDSYLELSELMGAHGIRDILWPWDYYPFLEHELGWCYWLDPDPVAAGEWALDPSYQELCSMLADEESRVVLARTLRFRAGEDLAFSAYRSPESQYFNSLTLSRLPSSRPVQYLDVGAYDGDTLQELCSLVDVGAAMLVEPEPRNFLCLTRRAKQLASAYPSLRPVLLPVGAGSRQGFCSLSGDGEAAAVHGVSDSRHQADRVVPVVPLDDLLPKEGFDMIKIDVEGYDVEALRGMRDILKRQPAVLAVSLYHRPRDFIAIPLVLRAMLGGMEYSYHLRQHMNNSFDQVLYAIPGCC